MPYEEWNNITTEDINKGIVIVDNVITYDNGQPSGTVPDFNEYVWVPIPESNNLNRTAWTTPFGTDSSGNIVEGTGVTQLLSDTVKENYFWEDTTANEYKNMISSIENYKGFYIGRYEASNNGSNTAQCKRNQTAWIVNYEDSILDACNNIAPNMHLIYGVEWDSVLNWLLGNAIIPSPVEGQTKTMEIADIQNDSSSWGNYITSTGDAAIGSGTPVKLTGNSEYWKANNIYDLAGNIDEYTQEWYSTTLLYTSRGGPCYLPLSVATRVGTVYGGDFSGGFRVSFFI